MSVSELDLFGPEMREAIEQFDACTMHGDKWRLIRSELIALTRASEGKQPLYRGGPKLQSRLLDTAALTSVPAWLRQLCAEAADALEAALDVRRAIERDAFCLERTRECPGRILEVFDRMLGLHVDERGQLQVHK